jgi:predicted aspartyl protease
MAAPGTSRQRQADLEIIPLARARGLWPDPAGFELGMAMRSSARSLLSVAVVFLSLAGFGEARAADCKPLRIINSVKMESVDNGNRFLVPVTINGSPQKLILDTGGVTTSLSRNAVKTLNLEEEFSGIQLNDLYGHEATGQVIVKSFDMGVAHAGKLKLKVAPMPDLEVRTGANGLLSTDLFLAYDIDMDFGAGRLNYFSSDHCEGKVAYWPERPVAIIPVILGNGHIIISVKLDDRFVNAIIDTGAPNSVLTLQAAKDVFGLVPDSAELKLSETSKDDPLLKSYTHKFGTLVFGDITVTNPKIEILTNRSGIEAEKSSFRGVLADPLNRNGTQQLIIGMDVLKHLHFYVAYGERKLYVSPAGTGESVLFKSAAASAN